MQKWEKSMRMLLSEISASCFSCHGATELRLVCQVDISLMNNFAALDTFGNSDQHIYSILYQLTFCLLFYAIFVSVANWFRIEHSASVAHNTRLIDLYSLIASAAYLRSHTHTIVSVIFFNEQSVSGFLHNKKIKNKTVSHISR